MRIAKQIFITLVLSFLLNTDTASAQDTNISVKELSILRINPSGEDVQPSRQIVFEFNQPVVPIGRMERNASEVSIEITPSLDCQWRWINTSSLACQLTEKNSMHFATRYNIKIAKGITSQNGAVIQSDFQHSFLTKRPELTYAWFKNWESPVEPYIYISFDQGVKESSIADHLYLKDSANKRYDLRIEALEDSKDERWLIYPKNKLPADSDFKLYVEPGIASQFGEEVSAQSKDILRFSTFGDFKFVGLKCSPMRRKKTEVSGNLTEEQDYSESYVKPFVIKVGEDKSNKMRCDPTNHVELLFSSPVVSDSIKSGLTVVPDLAGGKTDFDPWEYVSYDYSDVGRHERSIQYSQYMPVPLRAFETYILKASKGSLKDVFGRELANDFDFQFLTDHRPQKFHLNNQVSVLEKGVDSDLPLVVTNLDKVTMSYELLTKNSYQPFSNKIHDLYKVNDIAYPFPMKVKEILKGQSGIIQGNIHGSNIKDSKDKIRAGAWFYTQVTPYNIHAKLGHYNSLIWITNFSDGLPVDNAKVTILEGALTDLKNNKTLTNSSLTNQSGIATLEGLEKFDPELTLLNTWQHDKKRLIVRVEKDNDIAILPVSYDFDLSYDTLYPYSRKAYGHMKAWGTTAQGIYKLGDIVQYKIYARNQDLNNFIAPKNSTYQLKVYDPTGNVISERKDIKLNQFGAFDGTLELSKTWAVGWYSFELSSDFTKEKWNPLRVLVSDFTPASFRVTTEIKKKEFSIGDTVDIKTLARLHSGGPYADGNLRLTAHVSTDYLKFDNPILAGFQFGSGQDVQLKELLNQEVKLDNKGDHEAELKLKEELVHYGNIIFESSVTDERGKSIASFVKAKYFSRDRFVGLKQEDWLLEKGKNSQLKIVVTDTVGNMVPNVNIEVDIKYEEIKSAKVKSPGNAYLSQYETEWVKAGECKTVSQIEEVICDFKPQKPGSYRFTATIFDTKGAEQSSFIERYASGAGYVSWGADSSNGIDVIPEKKSYKPGETAKYLIKNPLIGSNALITIERYGIINSYIKKFEQSTEIIEVPITENQYPGFYLSVVLMSPRIEKPIENQVDLGKPTFKIGYAKTEVIDHSKELKFKITPQQDVYKPGETANLEFEVDNKVLKGDDIELAVAVLDESVFDLISAGQDYFDPFKGFYSLESLDVRNFNLLKQLIGRQKFEKKGANPGGGGGAGLDMRSVFKFVSYWNPSLNIQKNGKSNVSFKLPDNLTGWRVLAVAVNKSDRMGLAQANFKVNQSIEIRPALPNIVREGDLFEANFSLMNRTDKAKTVKASILAKGVIEKEQNTESEIILEPFKRENIGISLKAISDGEIEFNVNAGDGNDKDSLKTKIKVLKTAVLETAASYGSTEEAKSSETILFPENMRTDVGNVSVTLSPSVIAGIDSAYKYIKEYPYSCWEQKLTKAIMAAHFIPLKPYLKKDFEWKDADKIVKNTIAESASFQAANGGMSFFLPRNEFVSPYLSAYTSLAFNWFRKLGYEPSKVVEDKLDLYLLEYLKKDLSPEYYSKGMNSSTRAVALAALSYKKKINLQDLTRFETQLPEMDLFGKAHFLIAASQFENTLELQKKVADMLMSSANQTGGKYIFSENIDMVFSRILSSLPRSQCAVLSALISSKQKLGNKLPVSEDTFFKSLRSITQFRKAEGHWESTQENIFCMNALVNYSSVYEKTGANYSYEVKFDTEKLGSGKFSGVKSEPVTFEKELTENDPGKSKNLEIIKNGAGRIYYQAALTYSPANLKKDSVNSGIEVKRELSVERNGDWKLLNSPYQIERGELVRVDLFISVPAARNFVVVNDPIAGGLEPLNSDLATTSKADLAKLDKYERDSYFYTYDNWMHFSIFTSGFYHKEMRHDSARFYSEYLQAGNYHLSYLSQAIAAGQYLMLPLKAEEMYDSDVFGLGVPEEILIK